MTHVCILTITDRANFERVEHQSVWDTYTHAKDKAEQVKKYLIKRDQHHGLGDTFDINISIMYINTSYDL